MVVHGCPLTRWGQLVYIYLVSLVPKAFGGRWCNVGSFIVIGVFMLIMGCQMHHVEEASTAERLKERMKRPGTLWIMPSEPTQISGASKGQR